MSNKPPIGPIETVLVGTELKLTVEIAVRGNEDLTMDDFDFTASFFTQRGDMRTFTKDEMVRDSENLYIVVLDTTGMKGGLLRERTVAYIPDADCDDNYRTEPDEHPTRFNLVAR